MSGAPETAMQTVMRSISYVHTATPEAQVRIDMLEMQHFQVNVVALGELCPVADIILLDCDCFSPSEIETALAHLKVMGRPIIVRFQLARGITFRDQRAALLKAGAVDVIRSDATFDEIVTRLRAVLLQQRAPRILLVEDDDDIGPWVREELRRSEMDATLVTSLAAGRSAFEKGPFDALIVDRRLPDGDGLSFVAELYAAGIRTPALIYSARNSLSDRIEGLEVAGAVDYMCKPIHADELVVRIRIALRPINSEETLVFGPLELLRKDKVVRWRGTRIDLRPKESAMLIYLAERYGMSISQRMLYFDLWEKVYMEEGSNPVSAAKHRLVNNLKTHFKSIDEPFPDFLCSVNDSYFFDIKPLLRLSEQSASV